MLGRLWARCLLWKSCFAILLAELPHETSSLSFAGIDLGIKREVGSDDGAQLHDFISNLEHGAVDRHWVQSVLTHDHDLLGVDCQSKVRTGLEESCLEDAACEQQKNLSDKNFLDFGSCAGRYLQKLGWRCRTGALKRRFQTMWVPGRSPVWLHWQCGRHLILKDWCDKGYWGLYSGSTVGANCMYWKFFWLLASWRATFGGAWQ